MAVRWATCALLSMVLAIAACGGARGGTFDGQIYRSGPVAFRVGPVPSGWRLVEVHDESLAFRDEAHAASILVNARCKKVDEATPLSALTNHLLMGSTEREFLVQEPVEFDAREALHTRVNAKWDGVPLALDIYVLSKDGCVYDFVYMGDPAAFAEGSPAFERFVRGFATLPGSGVVS
jgi:hypothetical protein